MSSIFVAVIAATIAAVTSLISSDPEPMVYVAPLAQQTTTEEVSTPQVVPKAEAAEITYEPVSTTTPLRGRSSWYDFGLEGEPRYSEYTATCASRDYPRNSLLQVTRTDTGATVICRVADYVENPNVILDLSSFAFQQIASLSLGIVNVEVTNIACSCIKTARYYGAKIPYGIDAEDLKGNTTPEVGALALFKFANGESHAAIVTEIGPTGYKVKQGNKKPCIVDSEWILWTNPALTGFYKADNDSLAVDL